MYLWREIYRGRGKQVWLFEDPKHYKAKARIQISIKLFLPMRRIKSVFSFCEAIIAALFLYVLNNKRSFDAHFEFRSRRHYMKLRRLSNT